MLEPHGRLVRWAPLRNWSTGNTRAVTDQRRHDDGHHTAGNGHSPEHRSTAAREVRRYPPENAGLLWLLDPGQDHSGPGTGFLRIRQDSRGGTETPTQSPRAAETALPALAVVSDQWRNLLHVSGHLRHRV